MIYSLRGYGEMIADRVRMEGYVQALRQSVKPGSVVVDIGTGPGIFAILACQLGASRVFAIEPDEIIQLARENAAINGCSDRIEFFEDLSTRITLPLKADVIISDLRGVIPLFQSHLPSIVDARRRFLAPGGHLIPRADLLWAAIVELPKNYAAIVDHWESNNLGQDLSAARRVAVNVSQKARPKPEELLTAPRLWAKLDYMTVEDPDVCGEMEWTVERAGTGHGINVWFDADLADGVSFSNAPGRPETIYNSQFFPWTNPTHLAHGEIVRVQLEAKFIGEDYVWRWATQVHAANGTNVIRVQFDQSTMAGAILSPKTLRKAASTFVPRLSAEGALDRRILEMMDGRATLEQIAKDLTAEYPQRFARWQDALTAAASVSKKYSL